MKKKEGPKTKKILIELMKKNGGNLTPEMILDFARPKKSPLHDYFEWDNTKAAEQWRLHRARIMTTRIFFNSVSGPKDTVTKHRYFASVRDPDAGTRSYVSAVRGLANEDQREQIIADAKQYLRSARDALARLKVLTDLVGDLDLRAIDTILDRLDSVNAVELPLKTRRRSG